MIDDVEACEIKENTINIFGFLVEDNNLSLSITPMGSRILTSCM
jgi:hypothetical protein